MKSYTHFSKEERFFIDCEFNIHHKSIRSIGRDLNKSPSSVSREIKRNSFNGDYIFELANQLSKKRFGFKNNYFKRYSEFEKLFIQFFDKRSCGVYATLAKIKNNYPNIKIPSSRAIFRGIKNNKGIITRKDMLRKSYKKGGTPHNEIFGRVKPLLVKPIWIRPKIVDLRLEFGHWEGDLIVGKQTRPLMNIITLVERKTRMMIVKFIASKNPGKINVAIRDMIKENNLPIKSLTLDNGREFDKIGILAKWTNIIIYQCDPYASFQRGTNENQNGLIRRYGPKGTDLSQFSAEDLQKIVDKFNNMPRKIFNGKSSIQMFEKEKVAFYATYPRQK